MAFFRMHDNTDKIKHITRQNAIRALNIIGGMAETNTKALTPVDTGALRNSITHTVDNEKLQVTIGTNVEYAPYVELGTGNQYEPPEEWIEYHAKRGRGLDKWFYKDEKGNWHVGLPRKGVKMLQRGVKEHLEEYKAVIKSYLTND